MDLAKITSDIAIDILKAKIADFASEMSCRVKNIFFLLIYDCLITFFLDVRN